MNEKSNDMNSHGIIKVVFKRMRIGEACYPFNSRLKRLKRKFRNKFVQIKMVTKICSRDTNSTHTSMCWSCNIYFKELSLIGVEKVQGFRGGFNPYMRAVFRESSDWWEIDDIEMSRREVFTRSKKESQLFTEMEAIELTCLLHFRLT